MTSVLNVDEIAAKDGTSAVTLTKQSAAKHWLNYDQKDTVVIRGSFNTSSVSDASTGEIIPSFVSSMSDGNYSANLCSMATSSNLLGNRLGSSATMLTGSCQFIHYENSNAVDTDVLTTMLHGDLA